MFRPLSHYYAPATSKFIQNPILSGSTAEKGHVEALPDNGRWYGRGILVKRTGPSRASSVLIEQATDGPMCTRVCFRSSAIALELKMGWDGDWP